MNDEHAINEPIVNCTRHDATDAQYEAGVVESTENTHEKLVEIMTFEEPPDPGEVEERAERFADVVERTCKPETRTAMIGGAPFFMGAVEDALVARDIEPVYAFTQRDVEEVETDEGVEKRTVFKHQGFVRPRKGDA